MAPKISTFAGQLQHFAEAVDIVDKPTFDAVRRLVVRYVSQELRAQFFEFVQLVQWQPGRNGDQSAQLLGFWASDDTKLHSYWPVRTPAGDYTSPVTQSFASREPMWIVDANEGPLDQNSSENYRELWSNTLNLPIYKACAGMPVFTVIIVPLYSHRREFGAYYIECSKYFEPTDVAKSELLRLGNALRILYWLFETNGDSSACKERAINDLSEQLDRARFPRLAKPHFFVAYSQKADTEVRRLVHNVLGEFSSKLDVTDWAQMAGQGNISAQIAKEITESRFGLCYLSQPAEGAAQERHRYEDNANVLFEAGMLHARTSIDAGDNTGQPAGWIPVREEDSPPAPFDFAGDRILLVPRADGQINELEFKAQLRRRIEALLREE